MRTLNAVSSVAGENVVAEFLAALFPDRPANAYPMITAVAGDPGTAPEREWTGKGVNGSIPPLPPERGWYTSPALFNAERRNREHCLSVHAIVLDDIGSNGKTDPESIYLAPSWEIETSPDNCQWGYLLTEPVTYEQAATLLSALRERGVSDKSGSNPVRWFRLPGGFNNKASVISDYGQPFPVQFSVWHPDIRYSIADIAAAFGVSDQASPSQDSRFRTKEESARLAEEAIQSLLSGENAHDPALGLVGRWVAQGMSNAEIHAIMGVIAEQVAKVRGAARAKVLMGAELDRMIDGARNKGYAPPSADFSVLMESLRAGAKTVYIQETSRQIKPPARLVPDGMLRIPGVLNTGVQWMLQVAKKPQPVYAVQAMIALGATVLGRHYRTDHDNWPSLFLPVLGLSATGKEAIKKSIEEMLTTAELEHLIGPSKYTSDSGLMSSLLQQPSHICISDEFGKILEAAADPNNTIGRSTLRLMMEVWGRCDGVQRQTGYATSTLRPEVIKELAGRVVYNPALTFVGLSTPDAFYDALTRGSLIDGFINRMLIVECTEDRKPSVFNLKIDPPQQLIDWCKSVAPPGVVVSGNETPIHTSGALKPGDIITIPFSSAALSRVAEFDAWCIEQMNALQGEGLAEMYGRTNEIAMRLSLIVAVSCGASQIELEHLDWAISYVAYWTGQTVAQARARVADGATDAAIKDVERLLKAAGPAGMSMRELRKCSRKLAALTPRGQVDALQLLRADRVIELQVIKTKTKPKEIWVYIGDDVSVSENADSGTLH